MKLTTVYIRQRKKNSELVENLKKETMKKAKAKGSIEK